MLKAGVLALVAALTLLSPASAKTKEKCTSLDGIVKEVQGIAKDIKVEHKFVGDELKALNDKIESKYGLAPPAGQDGVILLSKPGAQKWVMVQSFNGCAGKISLMSPDFLQKLDAAPVKDNGSI